MSSSATVALPVLDIAPFRQNPESTEAKAFVNDLRDACHGPGFAYITGHGIDPAFDRDLLAQSHKFFALPEAERHELAIVNSPAFRGYTILGDERTNGLRDWRDQLDLGPEQLPPEDPSGEVWERLRGPNQWPRNLPALKPTALGWMDQMESLGLDTLRALALGLGQSMNIWDSAFLPTSDVHLKIIRYPRADASPGQPAQGVGPHHDSGLLTFILQTANGLQVETSAGFIDAPPLDGTYIMNLGEMMQRSTNGYLKATRHQVVSPTVGAERLSIAFFFNPRFETIFDPVDLPPNLAALAPGGQNKKSDDPIPALFGENNLKIRLRAHPDVAQRHYRDVEPSR